MARTVSTSEERRVRAAGASRYWIVWIALLVFTAITVLAARVHLPGAWALGVAMAIAIAKGSLVALFFMHLWDHGGANRLVLVTSLVFFGLLLTLVLADNASRFTLTNPPKADTMRWQPPGPDILSPGGEPRRSTERAGPGDRAPQEHR